MGFLKDIADKAAANNGPDGPEAKLLADRKEESQWAKIEECQNCLERATVLISTAIRKELGISEDDKRFHIRLKLSTTEAEHKFQLEIIEAVLRNRKLGAEVPPDEQKQFAAEQIRFIGVQEFLEKLDTAEHFTPLWKTIHGQRKIEENGHPYLQEDYNFSNIKHLIKGLNSRLSPENQINQADIIAAGEISRRVKTNAYGVAVFNR